MDQTNMKETMTRRNFIRTSAMAGGALLVQGSIPAMKHSGRQEAAAGPSNDGLLDGVCDIHLHCRPDSHHTPGIAWSGMLRQLLHEPCAWGQSESICRTEGCRDKRRPAAWQT